MFKRWVHRRDVELTLMKRIGDLEYAATILDDENKRLNKLVERLRAHDAQMTTQVVNLRLEVERLQGLVDDPRKLLKSSGLAQEVEQLRAALERARDELGMVTPDYPAPIANAARIIHQALQPTKEE